MYTSTEASYQYDNDDDYRYRSISNEFILDVLIGAPIMIHQYGELLGER